MQAHLLSLVESLSKYFCSIFFFFFSFQFFFHVYCLSVCLSVGLPIDLDTGRERNKGGTSCDVVETRRILLGHFVFVFVIHNYHNFKCTNN